MGINIDPSTSSSFSVTNTIVSNSRNIGISVSNGSGVLSKIITNSNRDGIFVFGAVNVTIVDSEAANNGNAGVEAGSSAVVILRNFVARYNTTGLQADTANTILRVAHSVITGNGTGVKAFAGTIFSYGDNDINGNANDNIGALTPLAMH